MATFHCPSSSHSHYKNCNSSFVDFRFRRSSHVVRCGRASCSNQDYPCVERDERRRLRILIAGGGIGGLVLALAAKHRGYDVKVFEKDLSAVRGEGRHRGPIQLLSSALAVLQVIDGTVAKQIMEAGCVTGDRINGVADGVSGKWFIKLNLLSHAMKRGLPVTSVICRMALQDILLNAVGLDIVRNKSKVVDFMQDSDKVTVILEDGQHYDGDVLVGADGIWSKVRSKLFGQEEAKYSDYTCYSGLANFVPPYIDTIGYRVFLGLNQYFVASDVGNGKMQWYGKKKRLLNLYGHWCKEVVELISETQEDMILRRDIYDRDMIYTWGIGRVTLLAMLLIRCSQIWGKAVDCYQLILELDKFVSSGLDFQHSNGISTMLRRYERKRMFRISTVHAASRMASKSLTAYRPYLEFGSEYIISKDNQTLSSCGTSFSTIFHAAIHDLDDGWPWIWVEEEQINLNSCYLPWPHP
uniref:FAD-binding domain-containing protein n=1 Tax=Salix viminalis TaxID=40686 RepID=A0A6N2KKX0_SALVM